MNKPKPHPEVTVLTLDGSINRIQKELSWSCLIDEFNQAFTDEEITKLEQDFSTLNSLLANLEGASGFSDSLQEKTRNRLETHRHRKMQVIGARLDDGVEKKLLRAVNANAEAMNFSDQEQRDSEMGEYLAYGAYRAPIYAHLMNAFYDQTPPYQSMIEGIDFLTVQMSAVVLGVSRGLPLTGPKETACDAIIQTPFDDVQPVIGQTTEPGSPNGIASGSGAGGGSGGGETSGAGTASSGSGGGQGTSGSGGSGGESGSGQQPQQ